MTLSTLCQKLEALSRPVESATWKYIFINTNEDPLEQTTKRCYAVSGVEKSCHIGFSGWHNFDIMSATRSTYCVVCDINPKNAAFIHQTIKVLGVAKDRFDFVQQIKPLMEEQKEEFHVNPFRGMFNAEWDVQITDELKVEGSWLSTDESFTFIQQAAMQGHIAALTENVVHAEVFEKVRKILNEEDVCLTSLYLSNICQFLTHEEEEGFVRTVSALVEDRTFVINTPQIVRPDDFMLPLMKYTQYLLMGEEVKREPNRLFKIEVDC